METIRRMARSRAKLFAAVVAAGSALPAAAQPPDQGVSVDAPRAPTQAPPNPLSVLPDAAQSAAFQIGSATVPAEPQPMPPGAAPAEPPASLAAPTAVAPGLPVTNGSWQPVTPIGPQYPTFTPPQPVAPAWRWHGYGAVVPTESMHSLPPTTTAGAAPTNSPTGGSTAPAAPTGLELSPSSNWRPPAANVATETAPQPLPPVTPVQTMSAADPAWRSGVQRAVYTPTMPLQAAQAQTPPIEVVTAAAKAVELRGPAVTLGAPRAAGTYISRAVSDAIVLPASYSTPATKPQPATGLPAVKASIERACAGRAGDVELVSRGPSNLLVRVKVRQQADAEFVANTIAKLPELGPYQVLFEMQVAR